MPSINSSKQTFATICLNIELPRFCGGGARVSVVAAVARTSANIIETTTIFIHILFIPLDSVLV